MGRTPCCSKEGLNRGAWTALEDKTLADYIGSHGEGKWRNLPKEAGLKRCGKSCRLRWLNYLRPDIKRGNISPEEEDLIIRLHKLLGNRWSLIAGRLPGRTDNEIKNYWNTTLGKKVKGEKLKDVKKKGKIESSPSEIVESNIIRPFPTKALTCTKVDDLNTKEPDQENSAAVLDLKYSDEGAALSFASEEYNPHNFMTHFNQEDEFLQSSDLSDSELWKQCQFDNGIDIEAVNGDGTSDPWPWPEEMLKDWMKNDSLDFHI